MLHLSTFNTLSGKLSDDTMLKLTFPIVKGTLVKHKRIILLLIFFSLALGVFPTLVAQLEAAVIDEIETAIANGSSEFITIQNVFQKPLDRFSESALSEEPDLLNRLANFIFGGITLTQAFFFYLLLSLIAYSISFLVNFLQADIKRQVFVALRGEGMKKALIIDPSSLPSLPNVAGQYAVAIHQGASNVSGTYDYIFSTIQSVVALATTIFLIVTKSAVFGICCFILISLQGLVSIIQARTLDNRRKLLDSKRNDLVARSDDILSKREIILVYEQQDRYKKKLDYLSREYANIGRKLDIKEKLFEIVSNMVSDYGRIIILLIALIIAFTLGGSAITSLGDAYFIIAIYSNISSVTLTLLRRYDSIKRSESISKTYLDVLTHQRQAWLKSKPIPSLSTPNLHGQSPAIEFNGVNFKYDSRRKRLVLNNCSFYVPSNATTLIVGRSGSGKSTIAKILLGFWPHTEGKILIHGKALTDYTIAELRALMSYVSQGDHIIDDSVRENLNWGHSKDGNSIPTENMLDTLLAVGIIRNPKDVSILSRPAKELSSGQQQRLSVARMMLDESDIVILDEPLTGVDVFTIQELLPHLEKVLRRSNRTVLMFSHNLSFAAFVDHVVVLGDNGCVIEQGSPKELLRQQGIFAQLYQAALSEFKLT